MALTRKENRHIKKKILLQHSPLQEDPRIITKVFGNIFAELPE